jgi:hypothetical protein
MTQRPGVLLSDDAPPIRGGKSRAVLRRSRADDEGRRVKPRNGNEDRELNREDVALTPSPGSRCSPRS